MLHDLFFSALDTITRSFDGNLNAEALYHMTESTFDLAYFSPAVVASLFDVTNTGSTTALEALTNCCMLGYQQLTTNAQPTEATVQVTLRGRRVLIYRERTHLVPLLFGLSCSGIGFVLPCFSSYAQLVLHTYPTAEQKFWKRA